jgi:hypothetical protein
MYSTVQQSVVTDWSFGHQGRVAVRKAECNRGPVAE